MAIRTIPGDKTLKAGMRIVSFTAAPAGVTQRSRGDGERCVTPARAAAKEIRMRINNKQPTYDLNSWNQTQATFVGVKCSQHCPIPAPTIHLCSDKSGTELIGLVAQCIPANSHALL